MHTLSVLMLSRTCYQRKLTLYVEAFSIDIRQKLSSTVQQKACEIDHILYCQKRILKIDWFLHLKNLFLSCKEEKTYTYIDNSFKRSILKVPTTSNLKSCYF